MRSPRGDQRAFSIFYTGTIGAGAAAAVIAIVVVLILLVVAVVALLFIGPKDLPRVMMTMGEDIPVLRPFARRSTGGAPAYAILFQLTVASLMLFTRSFEAVLDFIQFALLWGSTWVVASLAILAVLTMFAFVTIGLFSALLVDHYLSPLL